MFTWRRGGGGASENRPRDSRPLTWDIADPHIGSAIFGVEPGLVYVGRYAAFNLGYRPSDIFCPHIDPDILWSRRPYSAFNLGYFAVTIVLHLSDIGLVDCIRRGRSPARGFFETRIRMEDS